MIGEYRHLIAPIITEVPMLRSRSYQGPQPTVTVEYSATTLSRWGSFPVILQFLRNRQLPEKLPAITIPSAPKAHFRPLDKLMTLVTPFITGIARIGHSDRTLKGETALARVLGLDRFPSSDTPYDLLGKVTGWHLKQLDRIHRDYLEGPARFGEGPVIADLDLSVQSTEGRKREGATPGHDPKHKGRDCYRWAVAFVSGMVLWRQLYRGHTSGQGVVRTALEALLKRSPRRDVLRLDGGFFSAKVLNLVTGEGTQSLTKARSKLKSIRTLLERTRPDEWQGYDEDSWPRRYRGVQLLDDFTTPVTVVLVKCRRRIKKMKKGRLRWRTRTSSDAIVTDRHHWHTTKIYETYKARWAVGNFFKGSNQSFSSGKLRSGKFRGNQFFLGLLCVVYDLMQWFKRGCLPRGYRTMSFATVRRHFLEHAVVIEERGEEEIHLIFNMDYPLKRTANVMLRKALAA